jgi:hypothetical protein
MGPSTSNSGDLTITVLLVVHMKVRRSLRLSDDGDAERAISSTSAIDLKVLSSLSRIRTKQIAARTKAIPVAQWGQLAYPLVA